MKEIGWRQLLRFFSHPQYGEIHSTQKAFVELSKNVDLNKFIYSLSIPLIGRTASKMISEYFDYSFDNLLDYILQEELLMFVDKQLELQQ